MRTKISVPDDLFTAADALAARLGISRNDLYARALEMYIAKHNESEITARLDRVYGTEPSWLDEALRRVQQKSLAPESW
ncbi:MAG TPA: hypothetical protein VJT67_04520 [Longimicrobiaceae bacterium]|nr:hypothetical protein [Longimicrobiaceae bacterium]